MNKMQILPDTFVEKFSLLIEPKMQLYWKIKQKITKNNHIESFCHPAE